LYILFIIIIFIYSHFIIHIYCHHRWSLDGFFSAWLRIYYSALCAIAHQFVWPSHRQISQKRLKLASCNFHHRVAPWL